MLGSWLAFTYFTLVRKYVHNHVLGLMSGRTTSSNKMYYLASTGAWLGQMLILTIVFLIVKGNELDFSGKENVIEEEDGDWYQCLYKLNYWSTWA